jgi:hypothetical protein
MIVYRRIANDVASDLSDLGFELFTCRVKAAANRYRGDAYFFVISLDACWRAVSCNWGACVGGII